MTFSPQPFDTSGEADHRIANSLALLAGLVRLEARVAAKAAQSLSPGEVRSLLDGIAARIAAIGQLHRLLGREAGAGTVPLGAHLREICAVLTSAYSCEQQPLEIVHGGPECELPARYAQSLTLIVCEILANAMKYAHPSGVPLRLNLARELDGDGTIFLTISDDGVGLPEGFDSERDGGTGLQLVRALSHEIGARLSIESDGLGVTIRLALPARPAAQSEEAA